MRRRAYLAAMTALGVAGCSTDSGSATNTTDGTGEQATPTPTPTQTAASQFEDVADVRAQAEAIPYDKLFRNIDEYRDDAVYYEYASVYQVIYGDESDYLRMNVSTTDEVWQGDIAAWHFGDERILEDDRMEVWGVIYGLYEYETTQGNTRTTPAIYLADYDRRE